MYTIISVWILRFLGTNHHFLNISLHTIIIIIYLQN
jgi:hypothetical protein